MAKKKQEDFLTKDLWLASALAHLLKLQPTYQIEAGQVVFIFPKSDSLHRAIEAYSNSILYEYAQTVKKLRGEMFTRKNIGGVIMASQQEENRYRKITNDLPTMDSGNWIPMDKSLVVALPISTERLYSLVEAAYSLQVDIDNHTVKGYNDYARIWGWSRKKATNFIKYKQGTKTERPKDTTRTVSFRLIRPSRVSTGRAGAEQEPKADRAGATTIDTDTILNKRHKGSKPEGVRPGVFSFPKYCKEFPSKKENVQHDEDAKEVINYFLKEYKTRRKKDHPMLKSEQWKDVMDTLFDVYNHDLKRPENPGYPEDFMEMIDRYFTVEFQPGCNYSILHFNSNKVKLMRKYEVMGTS